MIKIEKHQVVNGFEFVYLIETGEGRQETGDQKKAGWKQEKGERILETGKSSEI